MADWTWTEEELDAEIKAVETRIDHDLIADNFTVSEDGKVIIFNTLANTLVTIPISLLSTFKDVERIEDCSDWVLNGLAGVLWMNSEDPLLVYNILRGLYGNKQWMSQYPEKITSRNEYLYFSQTLFKLPIDDPDYPDQEWLQEHKLRIETLLNDYAEDCKKALGY